MTPAAFQKLFEKKLNDIKYYNRETFPRIIGKIAVDHFQENFRLGGFVDDTLQPWKPSKRIGQGKGANAGYGTLLSGRVQLYKSLRAVAVPNKATIISSEPYSKIHNEGGQIPITPKMRKFAWAKYYEANPEKKGDAGGEWKGMALTKKTAIVIPKRKFAAHSKELNRQIIRVWVRDIKKILLP